MTEAADRLVLCQQMLGEIGTRSTITSLVPPDPSTEAYYCALFYQTTLQQVLRAAHWNCAGRSDTLTLWKALPGTPENPTIPPGYQWSNRDPAPPWLYSYVHPAGTIIQVRRVRAQQLPQAGSAAVGFGSIPLFGGAVTSPTNYNQLGYAKFEVATDVVDRLGNAVALTQTIATVTIVNSGSGYEGGDYLTSDAGGGQYGQPPRLQVLSANSAGGVLFLNIEDGGTFVMTGTSNFNQLSTTGSGAGVTFSATFAPNQRARQVILTNAQNALVDVTAGDIEVANYDPGFTDAFMLAMEGKLALALLGDKAMYQAKLQEANNTIIAARVRDGNEGLSVYDHVPDWLQVRGVGTMTPVDRYFPAYGPLFAV